ncbi:MAG: triphosphoribosyl-dephospho-CoA synthase [Halobacteriales archaeon]
MTHPTRASPSWSHTERAQLALALEVCGTPKPGNVDRHREYPDLRFEHFLAGAIGAREGIALAARDEQGHDGGAGGDDHSAGVGRAFERAVAGMSRQGGGNTQFGALLVVVPLVRAAASGDLSPEGATGVVEATTVADAADFYRAFEHVDVAVDDPPADMADLDVRRGSGAVPAIEERDITLREVMERSVDRDGVAREWVGGFERTFAAARTIEARDGPIPDRAADAFLELLAEEPDTFVATQHDGATAWRATERAKAALDGDLDPEALAEEFVNEGINPGTTADLIAGGLYVALEGGVSV